MLPAKNKYADSKSSAYLRGTWLKTKKYQTVILEVRELSHPENNVIPSIQYEMCMIYTHHCIRGSGKK